MRSTPWVRRAALRISCINLSSTRVFTSAATRTRLLDAEMQHDEALARQAHEHGHP